MKALSIRQPWASLIGIGEKTIEWRSWATPHRGDLLICAGSKSVTTDEGYIFPGGVAVAIAQLVDVRPFTLADLEPACMDELPEPPGFAWVLTDIREIEPIAVKGQLRLFEVDATAATFLPEDEWHIINPDSE